MNLNNVISDFSETPMMPALFVGHGSPMNGLEKNEFNREWTLIGNLLPIPRAIICISAHWETRGSYITINEQPKTIHDFYGFPRELYEQQYPAPGAPNLASEIIGQINQPQIEKDAEWGLDHGTWSVLRYLYPFANVPVIQLSIDHYKDAKWHYELGKQLAFLRKRGVLIIGSGNMIHNLRMMQIRQSDINAQYGYSWAIELNEIFKNRIEERNDKSLIDYTSLHKEIRYAIPTAEHYIPLLYIIGIRSPKDQIRIFNDKVIAGSLSMTSILLQPRNDK